MHQGYRLGITIGLGVLMAAAGVRAGEIGFVEDFALASDREAALAKLIPGTDDYYYYHCLHWQNRGEYEKVDELLQRWIKQHNYTPRVHEIEYRQTLLTYPQHHRQSLDRLQEYLGLQFNHQRQVSGAQPELPTSLDPQAIDRSALAQQAFHRFQDLSGFQSSALEWLVQEHLNPNQRRHLLQRLERPDYPNLPRLIVDDLDFQGSGGFGSLPVHSMLLIEQLDELIRLKPSLLNDNNYVAAYTRKLRPNDDENELGDPQVRKAYLERLLAFASRLAPAHNSLKANVLYHRLQWDQTQGIYDKSRFLEYVRLPRLVPYIARKFAEAPESRRYAADLSADFRQHIGLSPIVNDESLVRAYLAHFFATEDSYTAYEPFLDATFLKESFAETKIVNGIGDAERWYAMLPPEKYQALRDRIDIDFAPTNSRAIGVNDAVALDVDVKNVKTLLVKIFQINTQNYYRQEQREVNTDVNLDGLIPNEQQTYQYTESPFRRIRRHFEFPNLTEPGVYVVDFIGNGKSSRVVIRKGALAFLVRNTISGHVFTILDEARQPLEKATLWIDGHEYETDEEGEVLVPFSTNPARQAIVISHGGRSTLDFFQHEAENYALTAGIYVDREALIKHQKATALIRTGLTVNSIPVSLKKLTDVTLTTIATDLDGVESTQQIENFPVWEDRESEYQFQVPARLAEIRFVLAGKVRVESQAQDVTLSSEDRFTLNDIDRSAKVEDLHFAAIGGRYVIDVLGKTGEDRPLRAVQVQLTHRDFTQPVSVTLRTNDVGRIELGALPGITSVQATGPEGTTRTWQIEPDDHTQYQSVHGKAGETLLVPYTGNATESARNLFSLLALRGGTFSSDFFPNIEVAGGYLQLRDLPPGDYSLRLKETNQDYIVRIASGEQKLSYVLGDARQLEQRNTEPVQIKRVDVNDAAVRIELAHASKFARVHVFAARFQPEYNAFAHFSRVRDVEPVLRRLIPPLSLYQEGRNIGDEYQYILDRQQAVKFPGNTLERPSLLLNPWDVRSTETGEQLAAAGSEFAPQANAMPAAPQRSEMADARIAEVRGAANLDFLGDAPPVIVNLLPDEDGVVSIEREQLTGHQQLQIVVVDPLTTASQRVSLPEREHAFADLRLSSGLDANKHYTRKKQIRIISSAQTFELSDVSNSRFAAYDRLSSVYAVYRALSGDPELDQFAFVLNWDELKPEEKTAKYSEFACHELNFFLYHKDREFFRQVVRPYLVNKYDKTFMDQWLIETDLSAYLEPWRYSQLNVVERILLGQAMAAQRDAARQHVVDLWQLLPRDVPRWNFLFDVAVQGKSLDAAKGLEGAVMEKMSELSAETARGTRALGRGFAGGGGMGGVAAAPQSGAVDELSRDKSAEDRSLRLRRSGAARKMMESESLSDVAADMEEADADDYFDDGLAFGAREAAGKAFYRQLDSTKEWAENNYYRLPIEAQGPELVTVNDFWHDYAMHVPGQPFYSTNWVHASNSFTEMMLALAVLDLPVKGGEHQTEFDGPKLKLTAASPIIVFDEQVREVQATDEPSPVLTSQHFYRRDDRFRIEDGQQVDKFITDEFVVHTVYGCQVVVTNTSSTVQKVDVLLQVPLGAMPVTGARYTNTVHTELQPYHTQTLEYEFYFPMPGEFAHFPVHVSRDETLLAFAAPSTLHVVSEPTQIDRQSWAYVSQNGTNDDVLRFLREQNPHRSDLEMIAFRMSDKQFAEQVLKLLTERHVYHHTLWSYGIKHDLVDVIREYLKNQASFVAQCGDYLESPLLIIDPVERHAYQHLDYRPLVNARAHQLGRTRQIVNDRFHEQYHRLMKILCYRNRLDGHDEMSITYYLLLQDRIAEAAQHFATVEPEHLATRLQHDYFAAYFDCFNVDPQRAAAIAAEYADFPVDRWRHAFANVANIVEELRSGATRTVDPNDRTQTQTELASKQPNFDFQVETETVRLQYQNIRQVTVNYYLVDLELLFSRNPFVQGEAGQFSHIQPNSSQAIALPAGQSTHEWALPEQLRNQNVMVEISGSGIAKNQAHYANSMRVNLVENYGQLQVTDAKQNRPLAKVYVKTYVRTKDGLIRFYKDGYTDVRGRFDYSSLSTGNLDSVDRFAILLMSEDQGATVREAAPPKR